MNANITLLTLANSFLQWLYTTNNLANSVNELRNGNPYYKDSGGLIIANGTIQVLQTSGVGLTVASNATVGGTVTSNTIINTNNFSSLGPVFSVSSPNSIATFANTVITNNIFANNLTVSGNAIIEGTTTVNSNEIELRANSLVPGSAYIVVNRGGGANNSANIRWNEANSDWEIANVTNDLYYTILTSQVLSAFNPVLSGYGEGVTEVGIINSPNTYTCNLANTNIFDLTLANTAYNDITIKFINAQPSGTETPIKLILRQSAVSPNTVTIGNTVHWSGNTPPILSNGGSANVDVIQLLTVDGGVTFIGAQTGGGGANNNTVNAAANTVQVGSNWNFALYNKHLNFTNSNSVNVLVTANGSNADISFQTVANLQSNVSNVSITTSNFVMPFAPANNNPNLVFVTRNGLLQDPSKYSVSGNVLTLNTPAIAGETIETRVVSVIGGNGGGGGTSKVQITNANSVVLGTQSGSQNTFTYYAVPNIANRGMVSLIQLSANSNGLFQFQVVGANGSANVYLSAQSITNGTYSSGMVWYYESDVQGDQNLYIGIMNQGALPETFVLNQFRIERFA